jgi:hypothetical protein
VLLAIEICYSNTCRIKILWKKIRISKSCAQRRACAPLITEESLFSSVYRVAHKSLQSRCLTCCIECQVTFATLCISIYLLEAILSERYPFHRPQRTKCRCSQTYRLVDLDFLTLEDGTDRLSRNVGPELPLKTASYGSRAQFL